MLDPAQYQVRGTTASEIAASIEAAIRGRGLAPRDRLPTVRALAEQLGTSPGTISSAYATLRQRGLIITDGRRGTRIAPHPALRRSEPPRPLPYAGPATAGKRDLAIGLPDPALLPPLARALARVDLKHKLAPATLDVPDPELLELGRAAFAADSIPGGWMTVVSGAFDGIGRVLQAHLRIGDRVLVEDPTYTSILDLLTGLGLEAVPVPVDDLGLDPDRLGAALGTGARALVTVPRAQNPFGSAWDAERCDAIRRVLAAHPDLLVVEDDHASVIAGAPARTQAGVTERWAVVRSVSKMIHPDLRLALVAGDATTITRVDGQHALGPRWVSHILQATVVEVWRDPAFEATTARARATYAARREALIAALTDQGMRAHGRSGLNVWVLVRDEATVLSALSDHGWLAYGGARFRLASPPGIRLTIATLDPSEAHTVAEIIAAADEGSPRRGGY